MRVVVRIGGSVVASPVNTDLMIKYVEVVQTLKKQGHEVGVVVGGGCFLFVGHGYQGAGVA